MTISRRRFLGTAAGLAAVPLFAPRAHAALPREVDVVVVGAGAAGIAAARRIAASGRKVIVVEATSQAGGRCRTDTASFDAPFDRGARFLHNPDTNPLVRLARSEGFEIASSAPVQKVRIGRRNARARETEDLLATMVRASRAVGDAARGRADVSCAAALPNDLGDWTSTVEFVLGPLSTGKDIKDLSAVDGFRAQDRNAIIGVRQGLGALLGKLAAPLPVALSTPVTRIVWSGRDIGVETAAGKIAAKAIILTVSTNVLASGAIAFSPELPKRQLDAAMRLGLGSYDRIALTFKGNPLGLSRDEMMIEQSNSARTAVLSANVNGSSLCTVDVAGSFGRELSAQGEAAMQAFAVEWLSKLFGSDLAAAIDRKAATRWNASPYVMGAMSAAAPGGAASRKVLTEPLGNLIIAGEATSELMWGTVLGAWDSGEAAADAALKRIGPAKPAAAAEKPQRKPKQRRRNQEATGGTDRWPGSR